MENSKQVVEKAFLGFAILVILSGVYFIFQKEYIEGSTGLMIGILLLYLNKKKSEDQKTQ